MRRINRLRRRGGRESPMKKDEKTRKPLHIAAEAAELFDRLSAADQAAIIQQMKDLLAQKVNFCKKT